VITISEYHHSRDKIYYKYICVLHSHSIVLIYTKVLSLDIITDVTFVVATESYLSVDSVEKLTCRHFEKHILKLNDDA
jgi:hypothetical protein